MPIGSPRVWRSWTAQGDAHRATRPDRPFGGAEIGFGVDGRPDARIAVFTTRPDTLMGAIDVLLWHRLLRRSVFVRKQFRRVESEGILGNEQRLPDHCGGLVHLLEAFG